MLLQNRCTIQQTTYFLSSKIVSLPIALPIYPATMATSVSFRFVCAFFRNDILAFCTKSAKPQHSFNCKTKPLCLLVMLLLLPSIRMRMRTVRKIPRQNEHLRCVLRSEQGALSLRNTHTHALRNLLLRVFFLQYCVRIARVNEPRKLRHARMCGGCVLLAGQDVYASGAHVPPPSSRISYLDRQLTGTPFRPNDAAYNTRITPTPDAFLNRTHTILSHTHVIF